MCVAGQQPGPFRGEMNESMILQPIPALTCGISIDGFLCVCVWVVECPRIIQSIQAYLCRNNYSYDRYPGDPRMWNNHIWGSLGKRRENFDFPFKTHLFWLVFRLGIDLMPPRQKNSTRLPTQLQRKPRFTCIHLPVGAAECGSDFQFFTCAQLVRSDHRVNSVLWRRSQREEIFRGAAIRRPREVRV